MPVFYVPYELLLRGPSPLYRCSSGIISTYRHPFPHFPRTFYYIGAGIILRVANCRNFVAFNAMYMKPSESFFSARLIPRSMLAWNLFLRIEGIVSTLFRKSDSSLNPSVPRSRICCALSFGLGRHFQRIVFLLPLEATLADIRAGSTVLLAELCRTAAIGVHLRAHGHRQYRTGGPRNAQ